MMRIVLNVLIYSCRHAECDPHFRCLAGCVTWRIFIYSGSLFIYKSGMMVVSASWSHTENSMP